MRVSSDEKLLIKILRNFVLTLSVGIFILLIFLPNDSFNFLDHDKFLEAFGSFWFIAGMFIPVFAFDLRKAFESWLSMPVFRKLTSLLVVLYIIYTLRLLNLMFFVLLKEVYREYVSVNLSPLFFLVGALDLFYWNLPKILGLDFLTSAKGTIYYQLLEVIIIFCSTILIIPL